MSKRDNWRRVVRITLRVEHCGSSMGSLSQNGLELIPSPLEIVNCRRLDAVAASERWQNHVQGH